MARKKQSGITQIQVDGKKICVDQQRYLIYIQERLDKQFGKNVLIVRGRTKNKPTYSDFFCNHCGQTHSAIPTSVYNRKYPCECVRPLPPFAQLSDKDKTFLSFLYSDLYFNVEQICELTALQENAVRRALRASGKIRDKNNKGEQFGSLRHSLEVAGAQASVGFKQYRQYANVVTRYVYGMYPSILDPKQIRGNDQHLDHILSVANAYRKYSKPLPLNIVCHPANLRIISAPANLSKKQRNGHTLKQLKSKIKKFENKHGVVDFPKHLQLNFAAETGGPKANNRGLRVLGFDPGTANFGVFGGTLYGVKSLHHFGAKVSCMLQNTIRSMGEDLDDQLNAYLQEMRELILLVNPDVVIVERFQARGLKGTTIELVGLMIGALAGLLHNMEEELGHPIFIKLVMASQWKNAVNRQFDLDELYAKLPASQRHRLDACLMSMYAFPDTAVYKSLTSPRRAKLIKYIETTRK